MKNGAKLKRQYEMICHIKSKYLNFVPIRKLELIYLAQFKCITYAAFGQVLNNFFFYYDSCSKDGLKQSLDLNIIIR